MSIQDSIRSALLMAGVLLGGALAEPVASAAATFVIINNDGAGEGFNDPTAAAPVGGNSGTTVGQQRLIAFQYAADIWGARLVSSVPIRVSAQFNPLSCNASSAVLGQAGPVNFQRDFTGAPVASTWYAIALANALHGSDVDPASNDINATFSSTIGTPGCLETSGWYYGLDANPPANRIDFVAVLIHELGHGLGFLTGVNLSTGAKLLGFDDAYMRFLENHGASPSSYPAMTDAQRVAASISTGNLHWIGTNVQMASSILSSGKVGTHVRMYAPNPAQPGSSVSHWDTALTPNQIMEPSYTSALHTPSLELPLFQDIGWTIAATSSGTKAHDFNGDSKSDILWRQTGGSMVEWLMNGTSIASNPGVSGVTTDWQIVGTCDFNGDGKSDILWRQNTGAAAIWLMNGATILSSAAIGSAPTSWTVVGTGDFNGDGKCDILWHHTSGAVVMWLMNGTTVASNPSVGTVPTDWQIAGAGDFNGDGKADIVWRQTSGTVAVWLMNGASIVSNAITGGAPTDWQIVAIGDFNGDGKSDLLWRQTSTGTLVEWLMNGTAYASNPGVGTVATSWSIVMSGDYNGDGKSDFLWRDTSGTVAMWLMNGASILSNATVAGVTTDWQIQNVNPN